MFRFPYLAELCMHMYDLNPVSIKTSLKLLQKIDAVITSCIKELLYWCNFAVPEYYFSYTKQRLSCS